ncbi:MAG: helix-turn-helix domain-containing protein [Opitutaceae bacterium]|nr:helix-turn-helix domain-containing protein [Opitutaceae bacterium]
MQTIGERLEEARKKKGISIREAAEATKIRGDYLQKFETNHFDIGLTEIYTRGFLRTYSNFLKLPADRILNDYAALGRGEIRPRQPSREVYGRMDITVATATEKSERGPTTEEATPETVQARPQPHYPRTGSSLPKGLDPAVVFKYVKWGVIAVVVIVVLLVVKSMITGGTAPSASRASGAGSSGGPSSGEQTITLVALDTVVVRVCYKNADGSEGADVIRNTTLRQGQTLAVPWTAPIYIHASAGENLAVEFKGRRFPTGFNGVGRAQMEQPQAR